MEAITHAVDDHLVGFALIGAGYTICAGITVLAAPTPAPASWPFIAVSAALQCWR